MSKHHINFIISTSSGFEGIFELCCGLRGPTSFRFNTLKILISVVISIYHISPLQVVLRNFRTGAEIFDPPLVCLEGINAATVFGVALCIPAFLLWWFMRLESADFKLSLLHSHFWKCILRNICIHFRHHMNKTAQPKEATEPLLFLPMDLSSTKASKIWFSQHQRLAVWASTDMFWVISAQYSYSPYPHPWLCWGTQISRCLSKSAVFF